jgi:DNA-binding transcriptional MocR family regulator
VLYSIENKQKEGFNANFNFKGNLVMSQIHLDKWVNIYAQRVKSIRPSAVRMLFAAASRKDIISFAGGMPHPKSFPLEKIKEISRRLIEEEGEAAFQYGPSEGIWELREKIAELLQSEGIHVHGDDLIITDGAQQALDLLGKIFLDEGSTVVVEAPSYVGALNAFLAYEANVCGIPLDEEGLLIEELEERLKKRKNPPRFIYTIPNFQNPAGVTLSLERRKRLLEVAQRMGILLAEDNPYGRLRFEGEDLPHLRSYEEDLIYLGTFSKIFSPGLRIGWVVAPKPILEKMIKAKESVNLCPSPLTQRIILYFLKHYSLEEHIKKLKELYRERRDAMVKSLQEYFPEESSWTHPQGGFFVWVTLPSYVDTTKMLPKALEAKIAYIPGEAFFAEEESNNFIRLNFSYSEPEVIEEGIKRLAKVAKDYIALSRAFGSKKIPSQVERRKD